MTGAPIILSEGGHADLKAVMAVMDDSFDPRFGEAWTMAMRRPAAHARRLAEARARK